MNGPRDAKPTSEAGLRRVEAGLEDAASWVGRLFRGENLLELVTLIVVLGGALLIMADFLDLFRIKAGGIEVAARSGRDQHAYAQILIGAGVIGAALFARSTRQWPPAAAAAVLGLIALGITLIGDLHEATRSDLIQGGKLADASPAAGLWLEMVGAGLALFGGSLLAFLLGRSAGTETA